MVALLPLAWIAWKFTHDRLGANPIRELEIETGLWTLRLLAVTLAITPVRRAFGWNFLVKYRRMLGLFTFCYATVHLSMWREWTGSSRGATWATRSRSTDTS